MPARHLHGTIFTLVLEAAEDVRAEQFCVPEQQDYQNYGFRNDLRSQLQLAREHRPGRKRLHRAIHKDAGADLCEPAVLGEDDAPYVGVEEEILGDPFQSFTQPHRSKVLTVSE